MLEMVSGTLDGVDAAVVDLRVTETALEMGVATRQTVAYPSGADLVGSSG